ncbi:2,5-diamino-6-hydroxy-4-(5-phosphoribosylamino)p yrimidine1-reductase [Halorhabdus utahensis DSM 12940]|uniref:2,5-diamino-6-(ribosylamino)-4(3H)-pyrimidinone 5'-phosphate reductase n=1 Tax=Halorhabdus utahensis (strain DSM 12940 / JCM 11049 / AX-2) TaxID=519442 RepID=C7NSR9_HALUD|nr:2,5-diamino-6-(ribosylamino)-4(3H)-pyrimidinone 5'-phosphate reductase [Halorhabdus utahensis]ACV10730.1 2,5-diamino-6-hydroxy-4-(5-phosphoribosylamino)p yrimidine1-reductase [Halorhabdus utahensis DSM 12940]
MHVVVNAAMSADGKLSTHDREQVAISGEADFDRVDGLRADSDAVMVGVGTVLADDPSLTVDDPDRIAQRGDRGDPPQPARVVADSRARTPPDAQILDDEAETYLVVGERAATEKVERLESTGATVIAAGHDRVDLSAGLDALESHGIDRLMVEGGGELIFSLFADDLVDELSVFVGPMLIGGRDAPTLADGDGFLEGFPVLDLRDVEQMDGGVLLRWDVA